MRLLSSCHSILKSFFRSPSGDPSSPLSSHPLPPCPALSDSVSDSLNLCCLNVRGLKSNQHYIRWLLSNLSLDIFAISEHWLHDFDLHLFSSLHNDYKLIANSSPRQEDPIICTPRLIRGQGGVAIGWHKRLDHLVSPSPIISSHRAIAIELRSDLGPFYFVSVYLPSRTTSTDLFRDALDQLTAALLLLSPSANVIIMGDFTTDLDIHGGPLSTTSLNSQGRILLQFMARFNLLSAHLHKSNQLFSHTFESEAHSSVSTIEHILCSMHLLPEIHSTYPINDHSLNNSNHLPVFANLSSNLPPPSSSTTLPTQRSLLSPQNWSKTPKEMIFSRYTLPSKSHLSAILRNSPTLTSLQSHPNPIDTLLSEVSSSLLSCSRRILSRRIHPAKQPGWDSTLKLASKACKSCYHSWVRAGRPHSPENPLRKAYKAAKKSFRSRLHLQKKMP